MYSKGGLGGEKKAAGKPAKKPPKDDDSSEPDAPSEEEETPVAVAKVAVTPSSASLEKGATQQFKVTLLDASGNELTGRTVSWATSSSAVATVTSGGLVTAIDAGSATITAKSEDVSGTAAVSVTAPSTSPSTWIYPGDDIQAKVNANGSGTVFTVKAGIHRMQQVAPKSGQSFIGEPGAVMNGAKLLTSWQGSGPWYVTGQSTSMPSNSSSRCQTAYPRCDIPHDVYIDNAVKKHVTSLSAVASGTWFYDYSAGRIYVGDNPSGKTVEVTHTSSAFSGSASGVTIRGLTIEKYANRAQNGAIHGNSTTGWLVENNVLQFNHGVGLRVGHRMVVRGSKFLRNGQMGIGGIGDDVLVENNEIAYNNTVGYRPGWEAGGSKWVRTHRLVVRGNFAHHNKGAGLWTDIDNIYTLYENNRSEDNSGPGIFHEISYDAVIKNNIVKRNGVGDGHAYKAAGIRISNSTNVTVTGNVVEYNDNAIIGMQQNRGSGAYGPWKLRNLLVSNNTVKLNIGYVGLVFDDGDTQVLAGSNRFQGNTYFADTKSHWSWNKAIGWTTWRGTYSQDPSGTLTTF